MPQYSASFFPTGGAHRLVATDFHSAVAEAREIASRMPGVTRATVGGSEEGEQRAKFAVNVQKADWNVDEPSGGNNF